MLAEVDFKEGEYTKWDAVAPDYSFVKLKNYKNQEVKIPLSGKLKTRFQQAHANSQSELVFDNQYTLVIKVGAIISFTTGFGAYDLRDFNSLYKIKKDHQNEKSLPQPGQTRLCKEPWEPYSLGKKGEVIPCPRFPAMWDIGNPGELSIGIESLQQSLLNGDLNPVCKHCNVKPVASTTHLQQELEARETKTQKEDIVAELLSIQEINNSIPIPPPHLRYRISGTSDDKIFVHNGIIGSEQMMSYVDKYDLALERSLLDWGCGCGRYAHHITSKWPTVAYTGCDIDAEAINWCQTNLKHGHYVVTDPYPPTPFANEQFTSVIASSVMTHLTEANQQLWLGEVYRILKPGGIFIASVLGFTAASRNFWLPRKLKRKGFVDHHQDMALKGIAPDGYYRDVFQTEPYTRQKWSTFFEVKEYVPGGLMDYQDLVILQKRESILLNDQENSRSKSWFRTMFRH